MASSQNHPAPITTTHPIQVQPKSTPGCFLSSALRMRQSFANSQIFHRALFDVTPASVPPATPEWRQCARLPNSQKKNVGRCPFPNLEGIDIINYFINASAIAAVQAKFTITASPPVSYQMTLISNNLKRNQELLSYPLPMAIDQPSQQGNGYYGQYQPTPLPSPWMTLVSGAEASFDAIDDEGGTVRGPHAVSAVG